MAATVFSSKVKSSVLSLTGLLFIGIGKACWFLSKVPSLPERRCSDSGEKTSVYSYSPISSKSGASSSSKASLNLCKFKQIPVSVGWKKSDKGKSIVSLKKNSPSRFAPEMVPLRLELFNFALAKEIVI